MMNYLAVCGVLLCVMNASTFSAQDNLAATSKRKLESRCKEIAINMNNDRWEELPRFMSRNCKRMVLIDGGGTDHVITTEEQDRFSEIMKKHDPGNSFHDFMVEIMEKHERQMEDLSEAEQDQLKSSMGLVA